ncbi:MAG: hypothetical protein P8R54_08270 [Myxococcota bacterium]|nr:hypothetical protein [Myxococcota bacterium]
MNIRGICSMQTARGAQRRGPAAAEAPMRTATLALPGGVILGGAELARAGERLRR